MLVRKCQETLLKVENHSIIMHRLFLALHSLFLSAQKRIQLKYSTRIVYQTLPFIIAYWKCGSEDTKYFQLPNKNVNVFVHTQKRTKADENVYFVFPSL